MNRKLLLLMALVPFASSAQTVKIGYIATLSGQAAQLGIDSVDGFKLALQKLNGKLGGVPVELVVVDDQLKPEIGIEQAKRLVEKELGQPVNLLAYGRLEQVGALASRHPDTQLVIDHLGLPQPYEPPPPAQPWADLPKLLALAKHANVAVKITGAGTLSHELSRAGVDVVCLEAGAPFDAIETNAKRMFDAMTWFDRRIGSGDLLERLDAMPDFRLITAARWQGQPVRLYELRR